MAFKLRALTLISLTCDVKWEVAPHFPNRISADVRNVIFKNVAHLSTTYLLCLMLLLAELYFLS